MNGFEKYIHHEPNTGCWLWSGCTTNGGYGGFQFNGKITAAHRLAYEFYVGPIPDGMMVLHTCDVRCCVNPDHLWLGTHADNMSDRDAKKRNVFGEKHPLSKLSESDVKKIRASKESYSKLSEKYGVTKTMIKNVKLKRNWKHVND